MVSGIDITKSVRTILVKNWLDMGKIRLQVAGGTVIVRGRIQKSRADEPVTGLVLEELERSIRACKGVKNLRWALEEWKFDRGQWRRQND